MASILSPAEVMRVHPCFDEEAHVRVGRVHLLDGRVEHSLVLELFTPEGVGTMITPDASPAEEPAGAEG